VTPPLQQWVGFYYQSLGWSPLPLEPRTKDCIIPGWPTKAFTPAAFRDDANIGLKSINGLVIFDDDLTKRGKKLGDAFLPLTRAVYGRRSAPRSKRLYLCTALQECRTWLDLNGEHLHQLRVGVQDMAPPSVHPEGERLKWVGPLWRGMLTEVDEAALIMACNLRATAALIALHWPAHGRRLLRLAYARVLLETLGLSDDIATRVLELACELGGSDDKGIQHAAKAVRDTKDALVKNEKAIGATYIRKELPKGAELLRRLREWFGKTSEVDEAIERLNDRFAIISVGNKVVVMDNLPDGSIKKLWPFDEFKKLLSKEHVTITGKTVPLANFWIKHPVGRRYESLVYDMPGSAERCGPEDYNGYLGFTVAPKAGDWSKNKDHLLKIICSYNESLYAWVFNWMAALVQWPGLHAFTALVLRGKQGVGKGHFAHLMLGALFHRQQYLHIIGAGMLTGTFNEHLSGKVLVYADESTWGGDTKAANKLKGLVTESTVPIERKFLPIIEEPSCLHTIIASNDEWPVAVPKDDRRFTVLDVAEDERQNDEHFTPLRAELANGGLAAMLHDLLAHTINESALRHPPTTPGKEQVMLQSLKPIERWWYEKLLTGSLYGNKWKEHADKAILHEDYHAFLDKLRETRSRRSTETELGMFLSKYAGAVSERLIWRLLPLEDCRLCWVVECEWSKDHRWPENEDDEQMANRDEELPGM
jgi:hypothetical protein